MLKARHVKVSVSWKSISYRNKSYSFEGKIKATFSSALEHYGSKTLPVTALITKVFRMILILIVRQLLGVCQVLMQPRCMVMCSATNR